MGTDYPKGAKTKKRHILIPIILILAMRLFFYPVSGFPALAKKDISSQKPNLKVIDPLGKINKHYKLHEEVGSSFSLYDNLVSGHPIEIMIPEISKKNKIVAAFLIGIAKKESDWGVHSPQKNGRDCYNYWGYKGSYNLTDSGYSCFDSSQQAVEVVGKRIEELISQKINTPERMIVWKCGRSCANHDPKDVKKWISDVSSYFYLSADEAGKLNS